MNKYSKKSSISAANIFRTMLVVGAAVIIAISIVLIKTGETNAEKSMNETLVYMRNRCNNYDSYVAADKVKSLIGISDKTKELERCFAVSQTGISDDVLTEYAQNQRFSGIIVLDKDLKPIHDIHFLGNGYADWKDIINSDAIKEELIYPHKLYSARLYETNEKYYDYAAVASNDGKRIIFCYSQSMAGYSGNEVILLDNLFNQFKTNMDGMVFLTDGEKILSSNAEKFMGKDVDKCDFIKPDNFVKGEGKLSKFLHGTKVYYGGYGKYKNYYLYVIYPQKCIFVNQIVTLMWVLLVYVAAIFVFMFIGNKISKTHIAEINRQLSIIKAISEIYDITALVDIEKDTFEFIKAPEEILKRAEEYPPTTKNMLNYVLGNFVAVEYQEDYREFFNTETLEERLKDRNYIEYIYKEVTDKWYQIIFIPKKISPDGKLKSVVMIIKNITEQKEKELEYQQQLKETAEEATCANMAKTDFLRRMSHDIRTPINGIRGMIEIGNHFPNDAEKQRECREKIWQSSGFLLDLVNDVLDMSKLESGEIKLEKVPFDLNRIIDEIEAIVESQAKEMGIKLSVLSGGGADVKLIGSPLHLRQIIMNLVGNSIKYNKENGSVELLFKEISSDENKAVWQFICSDTGIGMSDEFKTHLFEPFAQENSSSRTSYKGTGLGLSITKSLVESMNGTIEYESVKGEGTKFTVNIPFEINKNIDSSISEDSVGFIPCSIEGVNILLVEDNEINMEIAEFILENAGAKVIKAWNGKEAVEKFEKSEQGSIDIILMDFMMPVMDGIEAAKNIRATNRADATTVPIIAMTANAFADDRQRGAEAGMNDHISKPIDSEKIIKVIAAYVKK